MIWGWGMIGADDLGKLMILGRITVKIGTLQPSATVCGRLRDKPSSN